MSLVLMKAIKVDSNEKRNIVSNIKLESETLYDDIKSAIRLHKGSLVECSSKKAKEDEVMFGEARKQNFARQSYQPRGRAKSESFGRNQTKKYRNFSDNRFSNQRRRSKSGSRSRSRSIGDN